MLILSLTAVARGPVRIEAQVPPDDPLWEGSGLVLKGPLGVDAEATAVGEGVLVRGEIEAELESGCRRCLVPVPIHIRDDFDALYEPLTEDEEAELGGEVYPMPTRGDELDLGAAVREQLLLRVPDFVVCGEACRGLCALCGADLNRTTCECAPPATEGPWDALKTIKFD